MCVKGRVWSSAAGTVLVPIPTQDGAVSHFPTAFHAKLIWAISEPTRMLGKPSQQPRKASLQAGCLVLDKSPHPGLTAIPCPRPRQGRRVAQRCPRSILHLQWDSAQVTLRVSLAQNLATLEAQNVLSCLSFVTVVQ